MKNAEMHMMAALGAALLSAALVVPTVWFSEARASTGPVVDHLDVLEASLAYKKPNAPKQPQKRTQGAPPEVKPEGVSRDENKVVEDKKPEDKKDAKPPEVIDPLDKFRRKEDDSGGGMPTETIGAFDGSEFGVGDVTKGDPYFARLAIDLGWSPPELARSGAEAPVGCIQMTKDGKIPQTTFKVKGDDDIATLAESALRDLKKKRNEQPEEVPTHLLKALTTRWVCFKFTAKSPD
ncbi:MAG: hypothetical protein JWP01_603 [Myxococcales bacterium]|nr:hypothetical protein [Myxococcales bacterium]